MSPLPLPTQHTDLLPGPAADRSEWASPAAAGVMPGATMMHAYNPGVYHLVQTLFDIVALTLAWYLTIYLRVLLNPLFPLHLTAQRLPQVAPPLSAILLLWIGTVWWRSLQPVHGSEAVAKLDALRISESALLVGAMATVVTFFSHGFGAEVSRSFVVLFAMVSYLCLIGSRFIECVMWDSLEKRWPTPKRLAILGDGLEAHFLAERIRRSRAGVIELAGLIRPANGVTDGTDREPVIGSTSDLAAVINSHGLDQIILLSRSLTSQELENCGRVARRMGVVISQAVGPVSFDATLSITTRYGFHLLERRPVSFSVTQERLKRTFDILIACFLLILLSPLLLAAAAAVKLSSRGPVLYKARRVGRGGRYFTFLKFRSMYHHLSDRERVAQKNEKHGHLFKIREDPRITPVGRVLRRFSIDELPQLICVIQGHMSLLGPRPLPIEDLDPDGMSRKYTNWAEQRARVLPGITGLWQIRGRSDLSFEEMMELDVEYIRKWSLLLDLQILLATPLAVLSGRGAY